MKELDPWVFLAVFQEMLGWWLWAIVALAVFGLALFAYVVVRERGLSSRSLIQAELAGVVGGFAALAFMWWITSSSLFDVGGPIDVILVLAIWTAGFVGVAVLTYGLMRARALRARRAGEDTAWSAGPAVGSPT